MPTIEIENLNKSYGDIHAVNNLSFSVEKGELFGLVGPDGAGKTTIFTILTTLILPDSGKVSILGLDLDKDYLKIRRKIGYLPGTFSLYPDLTVEENLQFFSSMYKSNIADNMEMIAPLWQQLLPFKDRRAMKLSGGMKQKLSLCCALIHKPEVLFLDEPTTGVDPVSRKEFWDILNDIHSQGITVLVSTPYMDEASRCHRIALMQKGEIISMATPPQIIRNFEGNLFSIPTTEIFHLLAIMGQCPVNCHFYAYGNELHVSFYGDPNILIPQFQQFMKEKQLSDLELIPIQPTIEDCFIELMERN
ncbi:MAG: ABC transporter ATP-binding protein [Bacteroidales bacterium]|jgi:ABC-type multidrug transport system ATPase subunit|nr:ABC transporter ATP-binding protein [Bacteroidales bacterium]